MTDHGDDDNDDDDDMEALSNTELDDRRGLLDVISLGRTLPALVSWRQQVDTIVSPTLFPTVFPTAHKPEAEDVLFVIVASPTDPLSTPEGSPSNVLVP
jgi:hypothetical protein